jgi:acyl-CoA hydrolase
VEVTAKVIHTGRTSLHVAIAVRAGDPRGGGLTDTTRCTIVFVAVNSTGGAVPVHPWTPANAEDVALQAYANKQMELRQAMDFALQTPPS